MCRPLFERREGNNYAWSSWCRGYSYGGAEHRRSLLCAVEGRWHHSTACELYRIASDCVDKPCGGASGSDGGAATAETLRMGLRRGQASLPRGAGEMMEVALSGGRVAVCAIKVGSVRARKHRHSSPIADREREREMHINKNLQRTLKLKLTIRTNHNLDTKLALKIHAKTHEYNAREGERERERET